MTDARPLPELIARLEDCLIIRLRLHWHELVNGGANAGLLRADLKEAAELLSDCRDALRLALAQQEELQHGELASQTGTPDAIRRDVVSVAENMVAAAPCDTVAPIHEHERVATSETLLSQGSPAPRVDPKDATVPLSEAELDELDRRLAADETQIRQHTRAWALMALRQLRSVTPPQSVPASGENDDAEFWHAHYDAALFNWNEAIARMQAAEAALRRCEQERDKALSDARKWEIDFKVAQVGQEQAIRERSEVRVARARLLEALRHLPFVIAQLRHAYQQLVNGCIEDPKSFANGLIAPQIRELEILGRLAVDPPPAPKEPV